MAKETKIGLALIVVLVCAFSIVLYKRMQDQQGVSYEEGSVASSNSSDSSRSLKEKYSPANHQQRKVRDGSATSDDDNVLLSQKEPRRLTETPKKKRDWSRPDTKQDGHTESHDLTAGKGSGSGNPFASGGSTQPAGNNTQGGFNNDNGNPFASNTQGSGQNGQTNARNVGFGAGEPAKKSPFGNTNPSPFGNSGVAKTEHKADEGSATSFDQTAAKSGTNPGTVRLFPAKKEPLNAHRRAGYIDRPRNDDQGKGSVFNLGPEQGNTTKQMQPLGGQRDAHPDDGRFESNDRRFADKTRNPRDGSAETTDTDNSRFPAGRKSTTVQSVSDTTVWPNRDGNTTVRKGAGELGTDQRGENRFGNNDGRGAFDKRDNGFGTPRTKTADTQFGRQEPLGKSARGTEWPTRKQTLGSVDGAATSYDERPADVNPADRPTYYTVQPGDNYWTISRKTYGTARYFSALARYNRRRIPDPKKMRPGMHVLTPTVAVLRSRNPDLFPPSRGGTPAGSPTRGVQQAGFFRDAQGRPQYRVAEGDTLSDIAQRHLGRASRWIQVYEMNKDRLRGSKNLTIGTELRLPADASRIRLVRGARQFR